MKAIIDYLDKVGVIADDSVAYNTGGPYPFTLKEYREFTEKLWNDAGGWDKAFEYAVEDAHFETYYVPFEYEGKKYVLDIMYGQGSAWFLKTEAAHLEYLADEEKEDGPKKSSKFNSETWKEVTRTVKALQE